MTEEVKPKELYIKCSGLGLNVNHVAEVGVYLPPTSNILDWINKDVRTTLVEPNPSSIKAINEYFNNRTNITLHKVAVFEKNGTITLYNRDASAFIAESGSSPAMVNDKYTPQEEDKIEVECKKFDEIDDGTIDILSVDIEGAEWYVIQNLVSRPAVIAIETHGKFYVNPKIEEIENWMETNGYEAWFKDQSDTVYVNTKYYTPTSSDKFRLRYKNFRLRLRRLKKIFKG